jgi:hypothetical protein
MTLVLKVEITHRKKVEITHRKKVKTNYKTQFSIDPVGPNVERLNL